MTVKEILHEYGPSAWIGAFSGLVMGSLSVLDPLLMWAASDGRFWIALGSIASSELPGGTGGALLIAVVGLVLVGKLYVRKKND